MALKIARIFVSVVVAAGFFLQGLLPGTAGLTAQAATPGTVQWLQSNSGYYTGPEANSGDQLGLSVSQSSDGAVYIAGAQNELVGSNSGQGAAYLDDPLGHYSLLASDGAAGDHFGISVALSGDGTTALVGAYQATVGGHLKQGAAYVFVKVANNWVEQQKLTVGSTAANLYFGVAVALSHDGNTALIGADGYTGSYSQQGGAYVFTRSGTTWSKQTATPLVAGDPAAGDWMGNAVALSGDGSVVLVGASGKSSNRGAAYSFTLYHGLWSSDHKFLAWDGVNGDDFGRSVSLSDSGNIALIGADNASVNGAAVAGAAYTYSHSAFGWFNWNKLTAKDRWLNDCFGFSVSLSGDGATALIGATNKTVDIHTAMGVGYVFFGPAFSSQQELAASNGQSNDAAGAAVSLNLDGSIALLGAPAAPNTGTLYRFDRYTSDWWQQPTLDGAASNSLLGHALAISADGNTAVFGSGDSWSSVLDAVYIYHQYLGQWYLQATIPTPDPGNEYQHGFGLSVAMSANGNTVIIGNYKATVGVNTMQGVAYITTRTGQTWSTPTEFSDPGNVPQDQFGYAVAVSGDGNTAVIGSNKYSSWRGAVYVTTRSGSNWSGLTRIDATDSPSSEFFGCSAALNYDGSTLIAGGCQSYNTPTFQAGAAYVFTRSGGVYSQQQKLTPGAGLGGPLNFGFSVALSDDGNTAAIGMPCPTCTASVGDVFIFTRSGSTWTKQTSFEALDIPDDTYAAPDLFGEAVDLTSDGNTLVIGAQYSLAYGDIKRGAVYVYTRSGTVWTLQAKLIAAESGKSSWDADAVAISGNGHTILFDAYKIGAYIGGVRFFTTNTPNYPLFVPAVKK